MSPANRAPSASAINSSPTAPLAGSLTLGVISTPGPYLLPWLVPLLKRTQPDLRLIQNEDLTDDLIERLRSHRLDAASASRRIGLVWRRAHPKGADLDLLARVIRAYLPSAVRTA
jgi:DNA-binding transcriptional LysR family regulator